MIKNSLSSAQKYRLAQWVEDIASTDKTILSWAMAAERASAALGFPVTYSNVQCAFEATETPAPGGNGRQGGSSSAQSKIRTTARAVVSLCLSLGYRPENYLDLLKAAERKEWTA